MTQQQAHSARFGPSWPEVAGFGAASPNKQIFRGLTEGQNAKNTQLWPQLPCLPLVETPIA